MDANELLVYLTRRQVKALFDAAKSLPPDRLDWKPAPDARSALDQLQEFATAIDQFWGAYTERKMSFGPEQFAAWKESRGKLTTIEELEAAAYQSTEKLLEFIGKFDAAEYGEPVELPFGGDHKMADVLAYHYWNGAYHEGQITYIKSLLTEND
jgi:uncharacterized damage-inducible protein DinB